MLTAEMLTGLRTVAGLGPIPVGSLSSDGIWFAYAVRAESSPAAKRDSYYDATGMPEDWISGSEIRVLNTRTREGTVVANAGKVMQPVWSPDGRHVAFYSNRDGLARLWVWNREQGTLRRISDVVARPSALGRGSLRWTRDSEQLIALVLPEGMTVPQANSRGKRPNKDPEEGSKLSSDTTVLVHRAGTERRMGAQAATLAPSTTSLWPTMEADVALISIQSGKVRRLSSQRVVSWYSLSPNGNELAVAYQSGHVPTVFQGLYTLDLISLKNGATRALATHTMADDGLFTWSPNGTRLAYFTAGDLAKDQVRIIDVQSGRHHDAISGVRTFKDPTSMERQRTVHWTADSESLLFVAQRRLWRVPAHGGEAIALTPTDWDRDVIRLLADDNLVWSPDSEPNAIAMTRNSQTKGFGFYSVGITSHRITKLQEEAKRYATSPTPVAVRDRANVIYLAEAASHPPELWCLDLLRDTSVVFTDLNPELRNVQFGTSRVLSYVGSEGQELRAALLLPPGYKEGVRVPLVVRAYPGSFTWSDYANVFGLTGSRGILNMQMLATRGYAVLLPEVPQRVGTPLPDLVSGINAAVNKTIDIGVADPSRLAVFGHSYGGYAALAAITHSNRFKAAISSAGPSDLVSTYGQLDERGNDTSASWAESARQGLMGGSLWQYRNRYIENSPIFYLDRVTTPLLLLHGANDTNVPPEQSEEVFVGLRRLGKEVEYRKYLDEGHAIEGEQNVVDYWNAVISWLDTHLDPNKHSVTQAVE